MRLRPAVFVAVALVGSVLSPMLLAPSPATAFSYTCSTAETDHYPVTSPWSDGVKVRFRIVRPNGGAGCPAKPGAGWPLIVILHGGGANRCAGAIASRTEMASWGYVVLSYTARGRPAPSVLGADGCNDVEDGIDALDDTGSGYNEVRDKLDMSQLVDWLSSNNSFSGCADPCAQTGNVGITGGSWGGFRSWANAVPSPTNPQFDTRVKATAPQFSQLLWRTLTSQSSDGAATPTARPFAGGTWGNVAWWGNQGWFTHWIRDHGKYAAELARLNHFNQTVPSLNANGSMTSGSAVLTISGTPSFTAADVGSPVTVAGAGSSTGATLLSTIAGYTSATQVTLATAASNTVTGKRVSWNTQGYWDSQLVIDDDPIIDKVSKITMPVLAQFGWLDGSQGIYNQVAIEAWRKITTPAEDKYLYLGSCSHYPDPCHENNRTHYRDTLRRFFDRYLKNDTNSAIRPPGTTTCGTTGPCVIYTIPPKYASSSSNPWTPTGQTWTVSSATSWPPSSSVTYTTYLRNDGSLTSTPESGNACTPGSAGTTGTGCSAVDNLAQSQPPIYDFCLDATYGATEAVSFTTGGFGSDGKLAEVEADLYLKTSTTRLQVYVDLYVTDNAGTDLKRIWQGEAQVAPVKRDATPNSATPYRFKFKPGGAAWTIGTGQKLRVKVASKYKVGFAPEHLPGTYTLYHNADYPSNVKITFVP